MDLRSKQTSPTRETFGQFLNDCTQRGVHLPLPLILYNGLLQLGSFLHNEVKRSHRLRQRLKRRPLLKMRPSRKWAPRTSPTSESFPFASFYLYCSSISQSYLTRNSFPFSSVIRSSTIYRRLRKLSGIAFVNEESLIRLSGFIEKGGTRCPVQSIILSN